ncbi:hypothetical protein FACS189432_00210 [Bacteroidia bacterium]|nr:hypothetical protein FACS189426_01750 [Bacteroidia bacterium]GHT26228.1 hypothetical protein FACS189432_00210 [Bacteroidia bacterium]
MSACVQDHKDIFDEPASIRMQHAVSEYKDLLASSPNGWLADYYPEKDHGIGGYAMALKFNSNGTVDVSCEIETNAKAGEVQTSQWDIISDRGPVLSFTTYNKVMHYFSEPYSWDVDGRYGDYEFVIMKAEGDVVEMKGKKHGNKLVLRKNTTGVTPSDYFKQVFEMDDKLSEFGMFSFVLNGVRIGMTAVVDRTFSIGYVDDKDKSDQTVKVAYTFTPTGIRFYEPFEFNGVTMQNFTWSASEEKYTCTDAGINAFFDVYFPADYQLRYGEFIGKWRWQFHGASTSTWVYADVEVTQKKKNSTYTLSCPEIFSFKGIEVSFDAQKGIISILNQNADKDAATGYDVRVCAYDRAAGYLSTGSTGPIGIVGIWNKDAGGVRSINFVDNGKWVTYKPNGFLLRLFNGSTSMGNYTTNIADYRFNDITMTKIAD